ncbi:sporulation protein [Synechococcus moorigangaii CMS01]|nr:sporulation protein [Synechococcus moorigangaii CMS01]
MFKKILASIGIGSAKVDTRLSQDYVTPGGMLEGEVHIEGGNVNQDIEGIYIHIATQYTKELDDHKYQAECILLKHQVSNGFHLKPKQQKNIRFSVQVPHQTPLSFGRQKVYIRTGLDIRQAIDPKDWDQLQVRPNRYMQHFFTALESLGFRIYKSDCEAGFSGSVYPFVQEFEFKPTQKYRNSFDELEVVFNMVPNCLNVRLEIDRRAAGRGLKGLLAEALDMDESYANLSILPHDIEQPVAALVGRIENILERYS